MRGAGRGVREVVARATLHVHLRTGACPTVQVEKRGLQRFSHSPWARGAVRQRVRLSYSPAPHEACLVPSRMPRGKRRAPRPAHGGGPGFQPGGREGQKDLASIQSPTGPAPPWAHSLRRHWGCRGHDRAQTAGCTASSQRLASSPHWPEAAGAAKALAMVGGGRGSLSGSTG